MKDGNYGVLTLSTSAVDSYGPLSYDFMGRSGLTAAKVDGGSAPLMDKQFASIALVALLSQPPYSILTVSTHCILPTKSTGDIIIT